MFELLDLLLLLVHVPNLKLFQKNSSSDSPLSLSLIETRGRLVFHPRRPERN